jgi:hypothetical protein
VVIVIDLQRPKQALLLRYIYLEVDVYLKIIKKKYLLVAEVRSITGAESDNADNPLNHWDVCT